MKPAKFHESFERLKHFSEKEQFRGWDPFDGLNSKLFQAIPFIRTNRLFRLAWIQFFKRSSVNLRRLALVEKDYNAKGLGLFLTGYCNLYKIDGSQEHLEKIHFLANKLIAMSSTKYSGACWGYNFDWQARAFFQPKGTPTVVATSFVTDSLLDAYQITNEVAWRNAAVSSADFVLNDLNRTYDERGDFAFSYSPLDNTQVFNASLLGAKLLSRVNSVEPRDELKSEAAKSVSFVCKRQKENGAWSYGTLDYHQWVDNFHTGFNLECLQVYRNATGDSSVDEFINKGLKYYLETFFTVEGVSKYYNNSTYPVDIHSPAQLIVTLAKLEQFANNRELIDRVVDWTIDNMQTTSGSFIYQKKERFSSKIAYMRWAQAWMFYALSYYLLNTKQTQ